MRAAIHYIGRFLQPYRTKLVLYGLLLVGITATTLIEPYIYKLIIDAITSAASVTSIDISLITGYLGLWAVTSLLGLLLFALYRYKIDMLFLTIIIKDYNLYAFHKIMQQDIRLHLEKKTGEVMRKLDTAGWAIFDLMFNFSLQFLPTWLTFLAVVVFASFIHWQMTLIAMVMIPVYLLIFLYGGIKTNEKQRSSVELYNSAIGHAYDAVANIQVVKSFAREEREFSLYRELMTRAITFQKKVSFFWSMLSTAQFFMTIVTRFIIFGAGIYFIYQGSLSVGSLIMFLSFANHIYAPLQVIGGQIQSFQKRLIDVQKAMDITEQQAEVRDKKEAGTLRVKQGEIVFQKVHFAYSNHKPVLKNLSVIMPAGKVTALVGHSGAGKTTVIAILNRFYDIQKGTITIDGINIQDVTQDSLRKNIGVVMQENTMFNDTLFNNIRYGNLKATKKQVIEAAEQANIHDFILTLPDQYKTTVGERGLKLSGGEKQRVAIARVILKNPPILILDEATSALDSETEKEIQEALKIVMQNRTTIVIAHRLATVRKADQILVLEKGELVEQGSHHELMAANGVYKKLVDLQIGGFLAE